MSFMFSDVCIAQADDSGHVPSKQILTLVIITLFIFPAAQETTDVTFLCISIC